MRVLVTSKNNTTVNSQLQEIDPPCSVDVAIGKRVVKFEVSKDGNAVIVFDSGPETTDGDPHRRTPG
jgi:hypothetical protein